MGYYKRTALSQLLFMFMNSRQRVKYLKKHNVFAKIGDNVFYQSKHIPVEPNLIKIHNNVSIASNVHLIPHDIINKVFNNSLETDQNGYKIHLGCIEICDNVFLGSHSVILPDVRIGPNAIVAAGAVVTKDVPEGTIVGGNPAKVIGSFYDLKERRKAEINVSLIKRERAEDLWKKFYEERDTNEH